MVKQGNILVRHVFMHWQSSRSYSILGGAVTCVGVRGTGESSWIMVLVSFSRRDGCKSSKDYLSPGVVP